MTKEIKCPKCKEEITSLYTCKNKFISGSMFINKEKEMEFEENYDLTEDQKPFDYKCPECNELLFTDDEEAENFLKGIKE